MQSSLWLRALDAKLQQKKEASAHNLKEDYAYLFLMKKQLYEHCTEAIRT